jgi:twitching motility protein PilT
LSIEPYLRALVECGGSDLHCKVGSPPRVRIDGRLRKLQAPVLTPADTEAFVAQVLREDLVEEFQKSNEADFAHSIPGVGRFRVNAFRSRGSAGLVFRRVSIGAIPLDDLGVPPVLTSLAMEPRGLVLVTGPTGSGKTTTLAGMVDHVNNNREVHIVTIEDPIEVLHYDKLGMINQREVRVDTEDFVTAMRAAMRQDPDVILVGEMRDHETVETALNAAETGHLVFSTLHTLDASETINRIIAVFPPHQQRQVRIQLSSVLKAAISQRLMPRADGMGRVPAVEVLVATPFIRDCIVDKDRTPQIAGAIAAGTSQYGMQSFDQSIFGLYQQGLVTLDEAMRWASNVDEFKLKVQGIGTTGEIAREEMAQSGGVGLGSEVFRFGG